MSDLYTEGWRQGSIFDARLPATYVTADESSVRGRLRRMLRAIAKPRVSLRTPPPRVITAYSDRWVVCTQDCDLASSQSDVEMPVVEIRPVLTDDHPSDWGIRSRKLKLSSADYIEADRVRAFVSPRLLNSFVSSREPPLVGGRARALKTWLGLRYDRPAVPSHLVTVAKEVAKRCSARSGRAVGEQIHDVLMQFDDSQEPVHIALFAVISHDADPTTVREWLADAARRISTDIGVVASIDVGTRAETSLELIETSYAADLTQLTWRGEEPTGAS